VKLSFISTLVLTLALKTGIAQPQPVLVEPGVSLNLAKYRKSIIDNINYNVSFSIPSKREEAIGGSAQITFNLKYAGAPLQLDFKQDAAHVKNVQIAGKPIRYEVINEHLVIPAQYLHKGKNAIQINFMAGNEALNRNDDYLYALFVPDHARLTFPCFDQPDLKAIFKLSLKVPKGWLAQSNGIQQQLLEHTNYREYQFAASDKLPTYLFSFTAGQYTAVNKRAGRYPAQFLHRETDSAKIKLSTDSIFMAHQHAISFLEQWTGINFPFQKVGFVAIPDFQFGGMEHPGEVQYKASSLFLDDGATKDQFISRANLISHETAHMWFGDLVTMQWFNDVWMKEVFANFMADKVTEKMMGTETFNLKFLQDHYPAAYGVDRTLGANPIRQQLDNLQEAGSMYGNIIYHKAPIMMRQLELLMGAENFRKGIQAYLKKYSYSNATWPNLIAILSQYTSFDLYAWNKVWVNQPGRPVFNYSVSYTGGTISRMVVNQQPELGAPRVWPQAFQVTLVYPGHQKSIAVNMQGSSIQLKEAVGLNKPSYIVFNANGMGYGLFPTDPEVKKNLYNLKSPLQRAATYIALYENMLAGRGFKPAEMLQLFQQGLSLENDEMNLRLLCGYLSAIYWNFTLPTQRLAIAPATEKALLNALELQKQANHKKVLFRTYQDVYSTAAAQAFMYGIWQKQQPPTGIKLSEDEYTAMALSIALRSDTATRILQQQQARLTNTDRKKRLDFLMPALSLNVQERDAFFESLHQRSNRQKEAWVTAALSYLHHPLRQATSQKYLSESLIMLEEIQQTGDIFFPQSWLNSIWGSYQSPEAALTVRAFLAAHPAYNPKLKNKILQAADNVFKAQQLLN
jgi:aminopeptidase N